MEIQGSVVKGEGYGKTLGFPTANIDRRSYARKKNKAKCGIYAGLVIREKSGKKYKAGIVVGPKDKKGLPKLEAHLLNFTGNLYGERLTFILKKYIRPFRAYKTILELKSAITRDIFKIKKLF